MTEAGPSSLRRSSFEARMHEENKRVVEEGMEVLTIDGDIEETVKKKKAKRKSFKGDTEGEAVMMKDLSARRGSKDEPSRKSHDQVRDAPEGLVSLSEQGGVGEC